MYKLREWVETVTGKGDRWGRDRWVGLSPPSWLPAALHSPHQPALHGERPANIICGHCFAARPANCWLFVSLRPVPGRESAGCVCLQQPCSAGFVSACSGLFSGLCLPVARLCHAHCPQRSSPRPVHFVCPLFIPCVPGSSCLQATSLQAARLSRWQQQRGSAVAARAPCYIHPHHYRCCKDCL